VDIRTKSERRWSALALIVTAQFMVVLDVAIVNVALPSIKTDLNFSQANLQWVISAYAILFGGALLLGGRLADLLGRRRLFVAGLALFTVSSLLCGLAWSESSLIAFRALQGLGGALLAPAALSLLMTTFAEGRERNLALGIYGAASGSGAAAGVLLGGVLTSYLSWSWVFFINIPVGVAAIALTPLLLQESRAGLANRHFDLPGAASITGGLMLLVYATTRATTDGWGTSTTIALLAGAAGLVLAFIAIELRSPSPLLPLRIFRVRSLTAANAAMAIVGSVAFSEFFLLTLYLQDVLHYSAMQSGAAFVAFASAVVVASNVAQVVVGRRDGALIRPYHDRKPHRRRTIRCRCGLGTDQYEPPGRGRDRPRCRERDRRHVDESLRAGPLRGYRVEQDRAGPRLPDRSLRAHRVAGHRRADCRRARQVGSGCERGRPGCRRRGGRTGRGSMMVAEEGLSDGFRKLDDLVLTLKGLVLVRRVRERRGADEGELLMYGAEIERVRGKLARLARSGE